MSSQALSQALGKGLQQAPEKAFLGLVRHRAWVLVELSRKILWDKSAWLSLCLHGGLVDTAPSLLTHLALLGPVHRETSLVK